MEEEEGEAGPRDLFHCFLFAERERARVMPLFPFDSKGGKSERCLWSRFIVKKKKKGKEKKGKEKSSLRSRLMREEERKKKNHFRSKKAKKKKEEEQKKEKRQKLLDLSSSTFSDARDHARSGDDGALLAGVFVA